MTASASPALRSALLPVCGERTHLPGDLVREALDLSGPGPDRTQDVERALRCTLQRHTTGDHFALVLDLDGPTTGSVWTRWTRGNQPPGVFVHPDCNATSSPGTGSEACSEFAGHPGGHSFDINDPWTAVPSATDRPLAAVPAAERRV